MNNLKLQETELNRKIHFRCPSCSKSYVSDPSFIYEDEPEYQCTSCGVEFCISLKDALNLSQVIGHEKPKVEEKKKPETIELSHSEPVKETLAHVKEQAEQVVQDLQFENAQAQKMDQAHEEHLNQASFDELNEMTEEMNWSSQWDVVLSDYLSREKHNNFISLCKKNDNLDYAIERYTQVLEDSPEDEMAENFLNKIFISLEGELKNNSDAATAVQPEVNSSQTISYILFFVLALSVAFVLVGVFNPKFKNLAGLGTAILFFIFAVRALFQSKSRY